MAENDLPSPIVRFFLGLAFAVVGVFVMLAGFDVGPMHARDINGPPWLGVVTGAIFIVGGVFLWFADALAHLPWLSSTFAALMFAGFAAIGNWIAFGAGPRECGGGHTGWLTNSARAAEVECRAVFGIGALMIDGLLVWMLGKGLAGVGHPGRLPEWIEKLGIGMLLLAIAPIILALIVLTFAKAPFEACVEYTRTGKWPRNEAFRSRQK